MKLPSESLKKRLERLQKLLFCCFGKVLKYLYICWCILIVGKCDFRIFVIFSQSVTFFAYFDNDSATFSKRAEFCSQNHQYSLGNIGVCSFFDFHSHLAELVVFTMPDLVFLVRFAKMLRGCSFG